MNALIGHHDGDWSVMSAMIAQSGLSEALAIATLVILGGVFAWIAGYIIRNQARLSAETAAARLMELGRKAAMAGDTAGALEHVREAEAKHPALADPKWQQWIAAVFLSSGAVDEALAHMRRALVGMSPDLLVYPAMVDQFCTCVLQNHAVALYPEAERMIRRAIEASPHEVSLKGTLGSILFELGRDAEAHSLLVHVFEHSKAPMDLGISAAYLSATAARRGERDKSESYRDQALKHLPDDPIVRRILAIAT